MTSEGFSDRPKRLDPRFGFGAIDRGNSTLMALIVALIPGLGTLALAIVSIGYNRFYGTFGIEPREAGFDGIAAVNRAYGALLTYSSVLAIPVLALVGLLVLLGLNWSLVIASEIGDRYSPRLIRNFIFVDSGLLMIWCFAFVFQSQMPSKGVTSEPHEDWLVSLIMNASSPITSLALLGPILVMTIVLMLKGQYSGVLAGSLILINFTLGILALLGSAYAVGQSYANQLLSTDATISRQTSVSSWFAVSVTCVSPKWSRPAERQAEGIPASNVYYLGGNGAGGILLLDGKPVPSRAYKPIW